MVTLSTEPVKLVKEIYADKNAAIAYFKKQFGGNRKYEKMKNKMLKQCSFTKLDVVSDVIEYVSKNGNRLRVFELARYFPDSDSAYTVPYVFAYYETYGSCGAFVPVGINEDDARAVVVFTSHFFQRFCQRLGFQYRSSAMIKNFIEMIPSMIVMKKTTFRGGHREVTVSLPGSIGNGVIRCETQTSPRYLLIDVRTFLTIPELSNKQKREIEQLRNAQQKIKYEPNDVKLNRYSKIINDNGVIDGSEMINAEVLQQMTALGHNPEVVQRYQNMQGWIMMLILQQYTIDSSALKNGILSKSISAQGVYDAAFRIVIYHEDWMSESMDVLVLAREWCRGLMHKELDIQRAYQYLSKAIYPDIEPQPFPELEHYLDAYKIKVEQFNKEHMTAL